MEENKRCEGCNGGKDPKLEEILNTYKKDKSNLIQILNEVQEYYGYVPEKAQIEISNYLDIPMAESYGVITFYVKGSEKILDRVKERLKIDVGETTPDGKYSLEATRCIGACGLAPVFTVNDEVYGKTTVKTIDEVLDKLEE